MKNKLGLVALAMSLMGGVAMADHDHDRWRDRDHDRGRVEVRGPRVDVVARGNTYNRHVWLGNHDRFYFNDGSYRAYHRPVIRERYYNYRVRPRMVVENYDSVNGYVWVPGAWQWNGREWLWFGGHYAVE